ncbi:hypothetical protein VP242E401_P0082 [Vibrio phage 242E40-1]|nr:hypothetical protein VP242E401_P0082 [Vibrio phage 242E40-1]
MNPTQKQKEIIELMKKGYVIRTTEGANYTCWLRKDDESSMNIPLNRATCESMDRKGLIVPDHKSKSRLPEWKLA